MIVTLITLPTRCLVADPIPLSFLSRMQEEYQTPTNVGVCVFLFSLTSSSYLIRLMVVI